MRQKIRRRPVLQVAAALAVAAPLALAPAAPAVALTADQATEAFDAFVDAYWDPGAEYFFTYSDHQVHAEHAHGPQGGLYTDYWWEAQLWEMVMDRYQRTGDPEARAMIDDVYDGFRTAYPDPLANDWNDDIGWWALGSTRAYELTGDERYLAAAEDLFAFVSAHEDDTYGGGIWWKNVDVGDGARNQKNVATNAPAVVTAMRLYAATGEPAYRDTAVRLYDWLDDGFHRNGQLRDHVEGDGTYVDWDWTYNQGTFAAAALEMYRDTGDAAYLDDATGAVDWAVAHLTSSGTFLREGVDDAGGFRAVLTRAVRALVDEAGQVQYEAVLTANASQAARQVNAQGIGGYDWTAPAPDLGTTAIQSLAAAATVAVLQHAEPDGSTGVVEGTGEYQAENAERSGMGSESSSDGYTGRGYLAGWVDDGSAVTFHVHVAEAREYPLALRYAAGAGAATRSLVVNGAATSVRFPGTSSWADWREVTVEVPLAAGHNTVVLAVDASAGDGNYLNLDRLVVPLGAGLDPEPVPDPAPVPDPEPVPDPAPFPDPGAGGAAGVRASDGGPEGVVASGSRGAPTVALAGTGASVASAVLIAAALAGAGVALLRRSARACRGD
ncbi:glycoside hydrolase family 76 protein [Cellulomonas sp. GbtcB1]|uniref:glycoside hydrolase family 76 protein n=1 Tax=Cellulomonas sp. GbtcB1 TaxID=2824746 RepID=UPI001C2F98EE|nr:glycoside hydrolase family 76 protein [Cellulomonas sp. GbtcB1]